MTTYTPKALAYISTIIKVAGSVTDWSAGLESETEVTVQEVQCMQIDDYIYIAGNENEDAHIKNFLERFVVGNELEFQYCLRYANGLFKLAYNFRKAPKKKPKSTDPAVIGVYYPHLYSAQDLNVINGFSAKKPDFLLDLTPDVINEMRRLITTAVANDDEKKLSWFLRKFVGVKAAQGAIKASGAPNAYLAMYNKSTAINVLQSKPAVHAELVLLTFLAESIADDPSLFTGKTIRIGGAKKACSYCAYWIRNYRRWILNTYDVTLEFPVDDGGDPRSVGSGAGNRPTSAKLISLGDYPALLFNGTAGSSSSVELNEIYNDETRWTRL
ncbi:hypothetical protein [Andreprevotia chitinilytica]|uniref:hypothetical protein n=1 Tax=Andreprevotia chitinilytica TaxID=396808 RepID=UPI00055506D9|nr:hypothetical protein [Andreprevotia chitinilytica]